MQLKLILAAVLGLTIGANATFHKNTPEMKLLWNTWKQVHSKTYTHSEEAKRFGIFTENYLKIVSHNAKSTTYKKGLNQFSDLTGAEFKQQYASGLKLDYTAKVHQGGDIDNSTTELPDSVDWRQKGAVTDIKDQGQCGSCWAFGTVGALEGLNFLSTGKLTSFSEQQLVDCVVVGAAGCQGADNLEAGFVYTTVAGIETEDTYPYVSGQTQVASKCTYDKKKAKRVNVGFKDVKVNDVDALKTALVQQPVTVGVEADQDIFQSYKSGVITADDDCGAKLDHAVLAVGYTTHDGKEAFIVKNSWGTTYGEQGYVYISTDGSANDGAGVCGILGAAVYPTA